MITFITELVFTNTSFKRSYVLFALSFLFVIDGLRNIIEYDKINIKKIFIMLIILELFFIAILGFGTINYLTLKNTVEGFILFIKIIVIIAIGFDIMRNVRKIRK